MSRQRVRLKRGDVEVDLAGEQAFVEAHLDRLVALMFGAQAGAPAPLRVRRNLDLPAFVALKQPQTPVDRLLVLAYYQERYEQRTSHSADELQRLWEAQWPDQAYDPGLPAMAQEAGTLQDAPEGRWTLSFTGEATVRDGLPES